MSKPYDVTTKALFEGYPEPWMAYLGVVPDGPIRVLDSDVSTVSAAVDKVYRIEGPNPYLVHVELQSSGDPSLDRRLWRYNAMLDVRHDMRVQSVALLLRPQADAEHLGGVLDLRLPNGDRVVEFHYKVVRAWEQATAPLLAGGLGTLPLAPLSNVPRAALPDLIGQIGARLMQEAPGETASTILEATLVLAGLRLEKDEIDELRGRLLSMNITWESSYFRLAHGEGRNEGKLEGRIEGQIEGQIKEAQKLIFLLGQIRFGPPSEDVRKTIEAITALERLEHLSTRLLSVSSWAELLAETGGP